jgi:hypothetical protein
MAAERWKRIERHPDYEISSMGRVRNVRTGYILKTYDDGKGYDAKDDRLGGNANMLNIMSMYSDIDLDANEMETEYQASFEELLYFINLHLANTGAGDFENEEIEVIFNRDMLISESEVIENIQKSVGILSEESILLILYAISVQDRFISS